MNSNKVVTIIFCAFIFELFIFQSGLHYQFLGITPRKIIFLIYAVAAFYFYINKKAYCCDELFLVCAWILYFIVWAFYVPVINGFNFANSFRDAAPLIGLIVFYFTKELLLSGGGWIYVRVCISFLIFIFCLLHIFIFLLGFVSIDYALDVAGFLKNFMEQDSYKIESSVFIVPQIYGGVRVYFVGSFILLVGLYYFDWIYSINKRLGITFLLADLLALGATLTRSFFLAIVVYVGVKFFVKKIINKTIFNLTDIYLFLIMPFLMSYLIGFVINPDILSYFGLGRTGSDELRYGQFIPLFDAFAENPIIGKGFGMVIEPVRNEDGPYSYELAIMALFAKIGLLGFGIAIYIISRSLNGCNIIGAYNNVSGLYALYSAIIFASFLNPYLFSFFGTFVMLIMMYEFSSFEISKDEI